MQENKTVFFEHKTESDQINRSSNDPSPLKMEIFKTYNDAGAGEVVNYNGRGLRLWNVGWVGVI